MYDPQTGQPVPQDETMLQEHFEDFYEDIFEELTNIGGELEQLRVCENLSDHLTGNVYAKFCEEDDAERALKALVVSFTECFGWGGWLVLVSEQQGSGGH